jgi:hypothetical protein
MALKNINLFEQHVEKIVIAVAGAGALFMGYMAMQPVTLPDNAEVGPKDVEKRISDEIDNLNRKQKGLEAAGRPRPEIPNYVAMYNNVAAGQPLEGKIVAYKPPSFGPTNLEPQFSTIEQEASVASVVPDPVGPEMLRAEVRQIQVNTDPPRVDANGQPIPIPAGSQLVTEPKNVVVIDGYIPVGKLVLQMLSEKDKKRFTPDVQRGIVYRVHVYRQEVLPNGTTTKREEIAPAKGFPAPTDVLVAMKDGALPTLLPEIDAQFQQIQLPNYYVDAHGQPVPPPILSRPIPQSIQDETAKLRTQIQAAQAGAVVGGGFQPAPAVPTGGTSADMFPNTIEQIRALEVQPFTFWDDSVKPSHTYIYSVKIDLVNPGYGWTFGLAKKALKLDPTIAVAEPDRIQQRVVVHSELAFFVTDSDARGVSGQIFKQKNGRWYQTSFSADKGTNISAIMSIDGQSLPVETNFSVVDYQGSGRNSRVILKDPAGNLVTRSVSDDVTSSNRNELLDQVKKGAADAAAAAAVDPVTGQPITTAAPTPATPAAPTPVPSRPTSPPVPTKR